ncbi:MAG: alpha/beta fold hydrolase [Syntrophomonadaceae bacterium]|nr:alpha/beta fold hydrolase [Syntrophomonadaceae bacterium]MDD3022329.1 alpha/beta fold hydrolase [Syntrophomonadaceae bacterium]
MLDLICGLQTFMNSIEGSGIDYIHNLSRDMFLNVGVAYKNSNRFWEKVESCKAVNLKDKKAERFCAENVHRDIDIAAHFGTTTPAADQYLLHFAPGWDKNRNSIPVVLIHGAGLDATSFTDLYSMGFQGMQQQLVELGYRVFAVTFSHPHGDNYYQAEQLADALARIREITKARQVDIVAHSKGGLATRLYLAGKSSNSYQGDIRRYIMLGVPNMGLDYPFRNPLQNYLVFTSGSNGVMAWDQILSMGTMVKTVDRAIYSDGCFPGQAQMLYRWDDEYPLDLLQQDWWTTYFGGSGFVSHSRGINTAIKDGDSMITQMDNWGIDPDVEISILAGNNSKFNSFPGESSGPSDGVVFVASAHHSDGLQKSGAKLRDKKILKVNHMELLFARKVVRWLDAQLRD